MFSFYSQNNKSNLWSIDFHKYETYHCLNQGTIYIVREVLQLNGGQLEDEAQNNNTWDRRHRQQR